MRFNILVSAITALTIVNLIINHNTCTLGLSDSENNTITIV